MFCVSIWRICPSASGSSAARSIASTPPANCVAMRPVLREAKACTQSFENQNGLNPSGASKGAMWGRSNCAGSLLARRNAFGNCLCWLQPIHALSHDGEKLPVRIRQTQADKPFKCRDLVLCRATDVLRKLRIVMCNECYQSLDGHGMVVLYIRIT